ncbi:MAG: hypothetical protein JO197_15735 [Acidobacteria bacterium]|nr:hypothetical protein [Acidobacteriota bacterium]
MATPQSPAAAVQRHAAVAPHVAAAMQRTMKVPAAAHVAAAVQPKTGPAPHVAAAMQRTMKAPAAAHVAAAVQPKAGPAPHVAAAMQRGVGAVQRAIAPAQRAGARVAAPAIQRRARGVVQCCLYCGDVFCYAGEKCARQSLFPPGSDSVGVKYYNQKGGHEGKPTEWEHVVPGASYRSAGMGGSYRSAPVIQIPKSVHRGGVSGCGGGISSTGSSASAKVYSSGVGGQLGVSFATALRSALADELNAAFVNGALNIELVNGLCRLIALHIERGDITQGEGGELQQFVISSYLNRLERPDLFGGKK